MVLPWFEDYNVKPLLKVFFSKWLCLCIDLKLMIRVDYGVITLKKLWERKKEKIGRVILFSGSDWSNLDSNYLNWGMEVRFEESSMIGIINEEVQACMTIAKVKVDKMGGYINISQGPSIGDNLGCIMEYGIHHRCLVHCASFLGWSCYFLLDVWY